jgi:hypothetical protein
MFIGFFAANFLTAYFIIFPGIDEEVWKFLFLT